MTIILLILAAILVPNVLLFTILAAIAPDILFSPGHGPLVLTKELALGVARRVKS